MYENKITSADPTLIIILIDQSDSMDRIMVQNESETYKVSTMAKIVTDNFLYTCLRKEVRGQTLKPYVDLAVIGYGTSIHSAIDTVNLDEFPIGADRLKQAAKKIDVTGDEIVPRPKYTWVEERADGLTPMVAAFKEAKKIIEKWLPSHKSSYPPTIINLTDGLPTDDLQYMEMLQDGYLGDLSQTELVSITDAIKQLHTDDGDVMIANCHITAEKAVQVEYPVNASAVEQIDPLASLLFAISSIIPEAARERGDSEQFGMDLKPGAKFFVFNAGVDSLTNLMLFGTSQLDSRMATDGTETKSLP